VYYLLQKSLILAFNATYREPDESVEIIIHYFKINCSVIPLSVPATIGKNGKQLSSLNEVHIVYTHNIFSAVNIDPEINKISFLSFRPALCVFHLQTYVDVHSERS
jgi:hypothetical protein